ncbi:uncharacterized protein RJT20DRAFT_63004 [Scheffersomyces xylosifermentans]|uniref:uncharacterized protein n=1 Tax=Scheffersomyces xylosifermentans TaxID=1304137 RepID=UPI00315CCA4A
MKLSVLLSIALLVTSAASQIVNTEEELICNNPENPLDCYPKHFVPTEEWQIIREGQDIPPGLHVRLNIDTLQKEAKLMDPTEDNGSQDIVAVPGTEHDSTNDEVPQHRGEELTQEQIQQKIEEFKKKKQSTTKPAKVNHQDLTSYGAAVDEVENYAGDNQRLSQALDTLIELSHDIEFGAKLTSDKAIFNNFIRVANAQDDGLITEKIYRIMGAALRNNPEATNNLLEKMDSDFIKNLFTNLSLETDVIQKRILGIIQGLAQNSHFSYEYFSPNKNQGIVDLVAVFPQLGHESKQRCVNILEDLKLIVRDDHDRRSVEEFNNADLQVSKFLQNSLVSNDIKSTEQFKTFFNKLAQLHDENSTLKPTPEFLNWLSREVEVRKENKKREDYSEEDREYDAKMLHARHVIFGNPLGLRKAVADEL